MPERIINSVPDGAITYRKTQWNGPCGKKMSEASLRSDKEHSSTFSLVVNETLNIRKWDKVFVINGYKATRPLRLYYAVIKL